MAKGSILVVVDEILLCWTLEEDLHREGYEVQIANTGNKGLAALEGDQHFDLFITNIRLKGGPDGWALARRAREVRPDIPVIFVSGDSMAKHRIDGVPGSYMLAKPFRFDRLRQALASLLTHKPLHNAARGHECDDGEQPVKERPGKLVEAKRQPDHDEAYKASSDSMRSIRNAPAAARPVGLKPPKK
jgi:DNA-binding NtrC family response regulator